MKFGDYLIELSSEYGKGITFFDIDETLFHTFAKIYVLKDGKIIKKLSNQEFNTYELQPGETFDFREFRDAQLFRSTSIPVEKSVKRIKRIFKNIEKRGSNVVLLTARNAFPDMKTFKQKFKDHGIPIENISIEFHRGKGTVAQEKKKTILNYLKTGEYRRVRLIDDDIKNIEFFKSIQHEIDDSIINKVKKRYNIKDDESIPPIQFFGLLVKSDGSLKQI